MFSGVGGERTPFFLFLWLSTPFKVLVNNCASLCRIIFSGISTSQAAWNYYDNLKSTSESFSVAEQESWNAQRKKKDASSS